MNGAFAIEVGLTRKAGRSGKMMAYTDEEIRKALEWEPGAFYTRMDGTKERYSRTRPEAMWRALMDVPPEKIKEETDEETK